MNKFIAFVVGLAAFFGLLSAPASAVSRPAPSKISAAEIEKICATKGRDNALFWRYCMRSGRIEDAARMWFVWTPLGVKGKEQRDGFDRRSICKFAYEYGGIRAAARETWTDPAYDAYHNYKYVLGWVGRFAEHDCRAMGYRV